MKFPNLFQPITINQLNLKNRIVLPAMVVGFADKDDGSVTDRYVDYMEARARGGTGLLIAEAAYVEHAGKILPGEIGISDDSHVQGLTRLAEAVHNHGSKLAIQLNHGGRQSLPAITGMEIVAPSPIPCPRRKVVPRELTIAEIKQLVRAFGEGAGRAKQAGADAVEIHGAHGYLINQFMSPASNARCDCYSSTPENRLRFALEIIAAIRTTVGEDFPIIFRISADEYIPGGLTLKDTIPMAKELSESGVDALHVSAATYGSSEIMIPPTQYRQGRLLHLAQAIKREVTIPVIGVGKLNTPDIAEKAIKNSMADMTAMGRALIADPDLANKAGSGNEDDIRRCVGCLQGCLRFHKIMGIRCLQNPAVGHPEDLHGIPAAQNIKKVVVVGGGPGGMEAARVAAVRGHQVTLIEKRDHLGGQINLAFVPPGKGDFKAVLSWREKQLKDLGVRLMLSTEADVEMVLKLNPDAVIMSTGSKPLIPNTIKFNASDISTADAVLKGSGVDSHRVAVVGGGMVGCETAIFLAEQGKEVIIVEALDEIARDAQERMKIVILRKIDEIGIETFPCLKCDSIENNTLSGTHNHKEVTIKADHFVLALGGKPDLELYELLSREFKGEMHLIGDSKEVRDAMEAIEEGFRVALDL